MFWRETQRAAATRTAAVGVGRRRSRGCGSGGVGYRVHYGCFGDRWTRWRRRVVTSHHRRYLAAAGLHHRRQQQLQSACGASANRRASYRVYDLLTGYRHHHRHHHQHRARSIYIVRGRRRRPSGFFFFFYVLFLSISTANTVAHARRHNTVDNDISPPPPPRIVNVSNIIILYKLNNFHKQNRRTRYLFRRILYISLSSDGIITRVPDIHSVHYSIGGRRRQKTVCVIRVRLGKVTTARGLPCHENRSETSEPDGYPHRHVPGRRRAGAAYPPFVTVVPDLAPVACRTSAK